MTCECKVPNNQCDQIRIFAKGFGDNFSYKCCPNFMELFLLWYFEAKKTIEATSEKQLTFIPTFGHHPTANHGQSNAKVICSPSPLTL